MFMGKIYTIKTFLRNIYFFKNTFSYADSTNPLYSDLLQSKLVAISKNQKITY